MLPMLPPLPMLRRRPEDDLLVPNQRLHAMLTRALRADYAFPPDRPLRCGSAGEQRSAAQHSGACWGAGHAGRALLRHVQVQEQTAARMRGQQGLLLPALPSRSGKVPCLQGRHTQHACSTCC